MPKRFLTSIGVRPGAVVFKTDNTILIETSDPVQEVRKRVERIAKLRYVSSGGSIKRRGYLYHGFGHIVVIDFLGRSPLIQLCNGRHLPVSDLNTRQLRDWASENELDVPDRWWTPSERLRVIAYLRDRGIESLEVYDE